MQPAEDSIADAGSISASAWSRAADAVTSGDHAPISMVCPREQGHITISLLFYKAVVPTQAGITGVSSSGKDMGL